MRNLLLSLLLTALSPVAFANSQIALDDVMSPQDIAAEVADQNPEFFEESLENLVFFVSSPRVEVVVNKAKSSQTMWVYVDGQHYYTWRVSTGREKAENPPSGRSYFSSTPTGSWTPYGMTYLHRSRTWDADMPFAIWLTGGIAIHAALPNYERLLGQRASGGCVRLSYQNAETLYRLVQQYGRKNTRVTIINR